MYGFVFICVYEYTISSRKNVLIFILKIFTGRKVNLVLTFGREKLKIRSIFQNNWEKQKKIE